MVGGSVHLCAHVCVCTFTGQRSTSSWDVCFEAESLTDVKLTK